MRLSNLCQFLWHFQHLGCWTSETCRLLVCDVMYYGTNSPTRLKRNRPPAIECTKLSIHLKMEARVYSRILPNLYHTVRRHNPKYVDLHSRRTGPLKILCSSKFICVPLYWVQSGCIAECGSTERRARAATSPTCCTAVGLFSTVRRFKSKSVR